MLSSAHKLAGAGAEFLICPDNTIHQAMHYVVPRSPRPWLHIAEIVGDTNSPLPTLDSTRLLARAASRRARTKD